MVGRSEDNMMHWKQVIIALIRGDGRGNIRDCQILKFNHHVNKENV